MPARVVAGADIVLRDRILEDASLVLEGGVIVAIEAGAIDGPSGAVRYDASGMIVVPGFIDVHVHGVEGADVLDGPSAVVEIASRLPRYGVTAFCPTTIACPPSSLSMVLTAVRGAAGLDGTRARVLGAHLESNFINPEFNGAQPAACLRLPPQNRTQTSAHHQGPGEFDGAEILAVIEQHRDAVGIVTMAPELAGGMELVRQLRDLGPIVSLGHTGASFDEARAAIDVGVSHATHLFNRMPPISHRAPGAAGAVLTSDAVVAELICDGFHVHPAMMQLAFAAKGPDGILAITDGTAGSGLPPGSRTRLGGLPIVVTDRTAELEDGTLAGSVLTMDGAFRTLVQRCGLSLVDAARLCATGPARQLGAAGLGHIELGMSADLVILGKDLRVRDTFVAGEPWRNTAREANV